ncbi:DUF2553 family protein [Parageobacillus toebii NBRC 107807]|uniref:DUF2553 family protein n=1 Tax=Parageobacillus toebii TaxID=153151 RepID=UPI000D36ED20|nr:MULTISPECIES: DUF2553 family protein [Parageobacillus]PUF90203.1 hypothetical protein DCC82_00295 [Geobacillus sp. LYN3]QNU36039.1 DUF2553 family protein [Geobacillus sp. 44C]TXK87331.1 DUF2553 family protein [Geobacillus sp. AYS3]TXK91033.1 DUF2553 family protein [Parageobacillus sp. SY1]MED4968946.1 DUF2553 family protein [Parageobacillus toebii]
MDKQITVTVGPDQQYVDCDGEAGWGRKQRCYAVAFLLYFAKTTIVSFPFLIHVETIVLFFHIINE